MSHPQILQPVLGPAPPYTAESSVTYERQCLQRASSLLLPISSCQECKASGWSIRAGLPLLQVSLPNSPESKCTDSSNSREDDDSSRSSSREVSLVFDGFKSTFWWQISAGGHGISWARVLLLYLLNTYCLYCIDMSIRRDEVG